MHMPTNTENRTPDKKPRAALKKAAAIQALNNLPFDLGRNRVLDAATSAAYWGVSLPHWRRLYRAGKVPCPIKIGDRKLGWRICQLADGLAKRADAAS